MKSHGCGEHQRTTENAWDEILHNIMDEPHWGRTMTDVIGHPGYFCLFSPPPTNYNAGCKPAFYDEMPLLQDMIERH